MGIKWLTGTGPNKYATGIVCGWRFGQFGDGLIVLDLSVVHVKTCILHLHFLVSAKKSEQRMLFGSLEAKSMYRIIQE
ncbi:MAG: hypothetical protein WCI45_12245 [Desulfuromonadales bacterium]